MADTLSNVVALTEGWPSGLKSCADAAALVAVSESRLRELADGMMAPHYRIDGGPPLFLISELKRWLGKNLLVRCEGASLPIRFATLHMGEEVTENPPTCLGALRNLRQLTTKELVPGIYFLCKSDEVVYVGQSVNPLARIGQHIRDKDFDRAYFIPCPASALDEVEAGFIRKLKPRLNGRGAAGTLKTNCGDHSNDERFINSVCGEGAFDSLEHHA